MTSAGAATNNAATDNVAQDIQALAVPADPTPTVVAVPKPTPSAVNTNQQQQDEQQGQQQEQGNLSIQLCNLLTEQNLSTYQCKQPLPKSQSKAWARSSNLVRDRNKKQPKPNETLQASTEPSHSPRPL